MTWNTVNPTPLDVYERAWGIIANANQGDWSTASPEWLEAARKFEQDYYAAIKRRDAMTVGGEPTE